MNRKATDSTLRRTLLVLFALLPVALACGEAAVDDDGSLKSDAAEESEPVLAYAAGNAYRFDWTFGRLEGARVRVVERPDLAPVTTDADGFFAFDGLVAGEEATLELTHPLFKKTRTATVVVGEEGIDDLHMQVPPRLITRVLSWVLLERMDPALCQIAATVTESGANPLWGGIEGVRVSIDPPLPPERGPIYFKIFLVPGWPMLDLPVRGLTETTDDGGVIFVNVPPGDYVLSAEKEGEAFTSATVHCRAGVLVNAAPPYGLQRIE